MTRLHPRLLLTIVLAPLLAVVAAVLPGMATAATAPTTSTVVLDGVTVTLPPGTNQVVTVKHTTGWHAHVVLWSRSNRTWSQVGSTTDGRTGYGGLVAGDQRKQGTGATPLGTYGLISAFGMHRRAASWKIGYRKVRKGDFWVEDNTSPYYNRYRNKRQGRFHWRWRSGANSSERLLDYRSQYEYAVATGYNYAEQVRYRGAGIFLHVNGRGATAGCVSVPRAMMQQIMGWLDPAQRPVIAIGH